MVAVFQGFTYFVSQSKGDFKDGCLIERQLLALTEVAGHRDVGGDARLIDSINEDGEVGLAQLQHGFGQLGQHLRVSLFADLRLRLHHQTPFPDTHNDDKMQPASHH